MSLFIQTIFNKTNISRIDNILNEIQTQNLKTLDLDSLFKAITSANDGITALSTTLNPLLKQDSDKYVEAWQKGITCLLAIEELASCSLRLGYTVPIDPKKLPQQILQHQMNMNLKECNQTTDIAKTFIYINNTIQSNSLDENQSESFTHLNATFTSIILNSKKRELASPVIPAQKMLKCVDGSGLPI
jgi:hypothetical protein